MKHSNCFISSSNNRKSWIHNVSLTWSRRAVNMCSLLMLLCRIFGYQTWIFNKLLFICSHTFHMQCCQCSFIKVMFEVSGPTFNQLTDDWKELSFAEASASPCSPDECATWRAVLVFWFMFWNQADIESCLERLHIYIILYWIGLRQWITLNVTICCLHRVIGMGTGTRFHSTDHHSSFTFRFISMYMNKKLLYHIWSWWKTKTPTPRTG